MSSTEQESKIDEVKSAASDVADQATSSASGVADTAKHEVKAVAQDARAQANNVLSTARTQLREQAHEQTKTLATTLNDLGQQLGHMADATDDPDAQVPALARSAADRLGRHAERLEEGGLDGLVADVKRFARNRPAAFVLASVAAGFGVGRLAKHVDLDEVKEQVKDEVSSATASTSQDHADADGADPIDPPLETWSAPPTPAGAPVVAVDPSTSAPGATSDR